MADPFLPAQPTLPPEGIFTEIEKAFIEESPPGLWPENQNSNFGAHRKAICEEMQQAYDEITEIYDNAFVDSANRWLYLWEALVELPINPEGINISDRRARVRTRMIRGPFTRTLRDTVIQNNLASGVAGPVPEFTSEGIPFDLTTSDDSGIPLFIENAVTGQFFQVDEFIEDYHYRVGITDGVIYDPVILTRELIRITPAGISFEIGKDYVKTGGASSALSGGGPKVIA